MFAVSVCSVRFSPTKVGGPGRRGGACLVLPCLLVLIAAAIPTWTAQAQCARTRMEAFLVQQNPVAAGTGSLSSARAIPVPSPQDLQSRWSRKDISWAYATGRANLSTYIPTLVGSYLPSLADSERLTIVGLSVMGAGVLVGPSMGQWCLGGRYARESILPTLVRAAGEGEVIWVMVWGSRQIENARGLGGGLGAMLAASFLTLPGILVVGLGVAWSINRTPPLACDSDERSTTSVSVGPVVDPQTGGRGLGLSIRL